MKMKAVDSRGQLDLTEETCDAALPFKALSHPSPYLCVFQRNELQWVVEMEQTLAADIVLDCKLLQEQNRPSLLIFMRIFSVWLLCRLMLWSKLWHSHCIFIVILKSTKYYMGQQYSSFNERTHEQHSLSKKEKVKWGYSYRIIENYNKRKKHLIYSTQTFAFTFVY